MIILNEPHAMVYWDAQASVLMWARATPVWAWHYMRLLRRDFEASRHHVRRRFTKLVAWLMPTDANLIISRKNLRE